MHHRQPDKPSVVAQPPAEQADEQPRAVVDETFHNFGILDPNQTCEYPFVIRNEGNAPLKLDRGGTSCKCTMSHLPQGEVPPGGKVPVVVASKVNDTKGDFSHRATILTNDPKLPEIDLQIAGKIRSILAALPPELTIRSNRGRGASEEVVVYSEVWDHLSLDIAPSNNTTFEIEPVDSPVLKQLGARSAQRIRVNLPPKDESGIYQEHLQITAAPPSPTESSHSLTVNVTQIVLNPIALHGDKFNSLFKELQFGPLRPREKTRSRVVLVVRDKRRELNAQKIEVEPPFLKVAMTPVETDKDKPAVYAIDVEVPENAPACNYLTDKAKVLIETDHPEYPKIEFKVSFAVISR